MTIQYNYSTNEWDQIVGIHVVDSYLRFPVDWDVLHIHKSKFWDMPHLALQNKLQDKTDFYVKRFVKLMPDRRWESCDMLRFESTLACGSLTCTGYSGNLPMVRYIFK